MKAQLGPPKKGQDQSQSKVGTVHFYSEKPTYIPQVKSEQLFLSCMQAQKCFYHTCKNCFLQFVISLLILSIEKTCAISLSIEEVMVISFLIFLSQISQKQTQILELANKRLVMYSKCSVETFCGTFFCTSVAFEYSLSKTKQSKKHTCKLAIKLQCLYTTKNILVSFFFFFTENVSSRWTKSAQSNQSAFFDPAPLRT